MSCVYGVPVVSWTPMRMSGSSARLGVWFVVLVGNVCVCPTFTLVCCSWNWQKLCDAMHEWFPERAWIPEEEKGGRESLLWPCPNPWRHQCDRARVRGQTVATPVKTGNGSPILGGSGSRRRHLPSASGRAAALRRPALSSRCRCVFYYLNALFKLLT